MYFVSCICTCTSIYVLYRVRCLCICLYLQMYMFMLGDRKQNVSFFPSANEGARLAIGFNVVSTQETIPDFVHVERKKAVRQQRFLCIYAVRPQADGRVWPVTHGNQKGPLRRIAASAR